jgi:hypothetical protein
VSPELNIYQIRVQQRATTDSDQPFSNKGLEHAAVVMRELFLKAQRSIYLFANNFDSSFYGRPEMLDAIESFLRQNDSVLKIGLENISVTDNLTLHSLCKNYPRKIEIAYFSNTTDIGENHFCIVDDKAYRLETDHDTKKAIVCFNDPSFAAKYSQEFLKYFYTAEKLDLTELNNNVALAIPH